MDLTGFELSLEWLASVLGLFRLICGRLLVVASEIIKVLNESEGHGSQPLWAKVARRNTNRVSVQNDGQLS